MEASGRVVATVGADVPPSRQGAFVYVYEQKSNKKNKRESLECFKCCETAGVAMRRYVFSFTLARHAVCVAELVTAATVALVRAVHVGAFLTARVTLALV